MIRHLRIPLLLFFLVLPLSNCRCVDRVDYGWDLGGPEEGDVAEIGPDSGPPPLDTVTPEDTTDATDTATDIVELIDTHSDDVDAWQPEDVLPVVCEDALNDRTSLVVDDDGTVWLGYHKYEGDDCEHSTLVVNHKQVGGSWVREDLQPHEGIFGLSSIETGRPIAVYPDPDDGTFKAAHRRGDRDWRFHEFDVGGRRVSRRDGFDVTEDGDQFYVTFAENNAPQVRLFTYDPSAANPNWESLRNLSVRDPQAAMERGLRADSDDSVYLVHRNRDRQRYGIARYDKDENRWPDQTYFSDENSEARVHSFVITDDFRLCQSSRLNDNLMVTCGTMFNLQMERKRFNRQQIPSRYPSSIVEGQDGTLYVAFHPADHSELKVAKRDPSGNWSVRTVFEQSSYGISTAIDQTGDLVMAFYTCDEVGAGQCSLKVLRENPDEL